MAGTVGGGGPWGVTAEAAVAPCPVPARTAAPPSVLLAEGDPLFTPHGAVAATAT